MGRAFEVRKAAMARGNLEKTKRYSRYGREIAHLAKIGGADPTANLSLRRLIDEAKKEQIPADIIDRALRKGAGLDKDDVKEVIYELIGPAGSHLLAVCLTDNVNRTLSDLRSVINKSKSRLASQGSILHSYQQLSYYLLDKTFEEESLEAFLMELLENDIEISDAKNTKEGLVIYSSPALHHKLGRYLNNNHSDINVLEDEIIYLADNDVTLDQESNQQFAFLLELLTNVDDLAKVYHNVAEETEAN